MSAGHIPGRPTWDCIACDEPWPCPSKREQLLEEHADTPENLRVAMALRLADAVADLRSLTAAALYRRFLYWVPGLESPPALYRPYVPDTWPANGRR